jgi:hypothetical protein
MEDGRRLTHDWRGFTGWMRRNWMPLTHAAFCCLVILPIAVRPGWPFNHDVRAFFEGVEVFRRELAAGNLFPLWTPFCFNGHGSPVPLFYHRLFNTTAGALALLFGTPTGIKLTLMLSLFVGSLGISAAARELGCRPAVRLWCGAILPVAHYTFVDWLIRGSTAELTAGMLVPWLLYVCLRMQSGKAFGTRLGAVLVLLFYAHICVFLYSLPLLLLSITAHVARRGGARPGMKYLAQELGVAAAMVAVGVTPLALVIRLVGKEFNLGHFSIFVPQRQFVSLWRYLADDFPWGHAWQGFSVEVGRFLVLALLLCLGILIVTRSRPSWRSSGFLGATAAAYFFFQLPVARNLYLALPISQILQFPWRLLAYITPVVILALAVLVQSVFNLGGGWRYVAVGVLVGTWTAQLSFAITAYRADYQWITPREIRERTKYLDGPRAVEYLPRRIADRPVPPETPLLTYEGCRLLSSSVDLSRLETIPFETVDLKFEASGACKVHFSQFVTSLIRVEPSAGGRVARADDETTDITLPPGTSSLRIERRGVLRTLGYLWRTRSR